MNKRNFFGTIMLLMLVNVQCIPKKEDIQKSEALKTTNIKNMEWTTSNLKAITFRNGDTIPVITKLSNSGPGYSACYIIRDVKSNLIKEVFYNDLAVTDPRGLAPEGFHIPSYREWRLLESKLGKDKYESGKKIKSQTGWNEPEKTWSNKSEKDNIKLTKRLVDNGGNGTDIYGMNITPNVMANTEVPKLSSGKYARFWTLDPDGNTSTVMLNSNDGYIEFLAARFEGALYSIRLVRIY